MPISCMQYDQLKLFVSRKLSQAEPRDAVVNFDTFEFDNKSIMKRLYVRTLNTATLSTLTHGTKPAQNTLNHV